MQKNYMNAIAQVFKTAFKEKRFKAAITAAEHFFIIEIFLMEP